MSRQREVRALYLVVQDLERAHQRGELTPSFIDEYALKYRENPLALYKIAAKNFMTISHEKGRNDHVLTPWESKIDQSALDNALDAQSIELMRRVRLLKESAQPSSLRKASKNYPKLKDDCY